MRKRVLLTATVQSHIRHFHVPLIDMLKARGYEVHVAARDDLSECGLSLPSADAIFDIPFARSPIHSCNITAYRNLYALIEANKYSIIHCNTPVAGVITRLAARRSRSLGTKVLYMVHGFHFYHGASLSSWLIYYPVEKLMAGLTDCLVTINHEDYLTSTVRKFPSEIRHVHGVGVNTLKFHPIDTQERARRRREYGYGELDYIVLTVGELNNNKNQKTIVKAMSLARNSISNIKLLIAGQGPNRESLHELINNLRLCSSVSLLGYRTDMDRLIPIADVVVSASMREGLPLNVLEAIACGVPVVASLNRGHKELIVNGLSGMLFRHDDPQQLERAILQLYADREQVASIVKNGYNVIKPYRLENALQETMTIYQELLGTEPSDHPRTEHGEVTQCSVDWRVRGGLR